MRRVIWTSLAILAVACGGASEQADTTTPDPADGTPAPEGDATPEGDEGDEGGDAASWTDLDREARLALMREQVVPRMGGIFRELDAEEFATFTCATCHGDDFQSVDFRMPNGVHPLVPAEIPNLASSDDEEIARAAQFMFSRVAPGIVEILNVQPWTPETPKGFGCLSCHATAE